MLEPGRCQCHQYPVIMNVRGNTSNTGYLILGLTAEDNRRALESDSCLRVFVQMSLGSGICKMGCNGSHFSFEWLGAIQYFISDSCHWMC
jgi:hypothetical protein